MDGFKICKVMPWWSKAPVCVKRISSSRIFPMDEDDGSTNGTKIQVPPTSAKPVAVPPRILFKIKKKIDTIKSIRTEPKVIVHGGFDESKH